MSDRINIAGLEIFAHVGVPDAERARRQKLLVNVGLRVRSVEEAARTGDLALTVDYAALCNAIKDVAAKRPRKLIETLAEDIAVAALAHERVKEATVEIEKFILPDTRCVSVKISRKRRDLEAAKKKKEKEAKAQRKIKQLPTTGAPKTVKPASPSSIKAAGVDAPAPAKS